MALSPDRTSETIADDAANKSVPANGRLWSALLALAPIVFVAGNAMLIVWLTMKPYLFFEYVAHLYAFNTIVVPAVAGAAGLAGLATWRRVAERRPLRRAIVACLAAAPALLALRVYATHIEPRRLQVRTVAIASPKLTRPLRLLHISDIQAPAVGSYEARAFATMRSLRPDLVIFTGDLLQPLPPATYAGELPKIGRLLASLDAPLGKFAVGGDVDPPLVLDAYEQWGFRLLDGQRATVDAGGLRIDLLGLPRFASRGGDPARSPIEAFLNETDSSDLRLVFAHGPDFALEARNLPIDLCLAGHTHGGQIRIPFVGPIITLSRVPRAWARGYREIGATRLNVSAGIGCEHLAGLPNIRFACPPEMTLFELRPGRPDAP